MSKNIAGVPIPQPASEGPLTREMALAMLERALKHCFPDRWQEILQALRLKSDGDKLVEWLSLGVARHPGTALGAMIGGVMGMALADVARRGGR